MKTWQRYGICIALGLVGGAAYAVHQVRGDYADKQVHNGQWSANTDQGTASASALTRAKVALYGLLALPAKEAMYFITRTDSEGRPLDGRCTYTVAGGELDARWWSVTLYKGEGWLVKNAAKRWSVPASAVQIDEAGGWSFTVAPSAQAGTWLPTGSVPKFDLTLRLYHPSAMTIKSPETAKLPTIERKECV